jgi:L-lactate utilization protein LutC
MAIDRDNFLRRVREAVATGNRAGVVPPLPERGNVGYQGAGPDPVARFRDELAAAGGQAHVAPDHAAAVAKVLELVETKAARRVLLGGGAVIDSLNLADALRSRGVEVSDPTTGREAAFAADVGVTGVDYLIAETGSLALLTRPEQPRLFSLLPPVHVAVAERSQILPDLFDLFAIEQKDVPACLSLITGPSKTGDIELRLVTGVHGPGEVHVVLIDPGG